LYIYEYEYEQWNPYNNETIQILSITMQLSNVNDSLNKGVFKFQLSIKVEFRYFVKGSKTLSLNNFIFIPTNKQPRYQEIQKPNSIWKQATQGDWKIKWSDAPHVFVKRYSKVQFQNNTGLAQLRVGKNTVWNSVFIYSK